MNLDGIIIIAKVALFMFRKCGHIGINYSVSVFHTIVLIKFFKWAFWNKNYNDFRYDISGYKN